MKNKQHQLGFTMIELLVVVVILGLLASLVAPNFFSKLASSERSVAKTQMAAFSMAIDTYRLDMKTYPEKLEQLRSQDHPKWDGPYLPKDVPLDPWGNPYHYKKPGNEGRPFDLMSYGADGAPGGEDNDADIIYE